MSTNTTKQTAQAKAREAYAAAMKDLQERYAHLQIKDNSLIQDEDHPKFKNKRRVTVVCDCGVEVERATSDLHTFIGCESCKKEVRKANKTLKKGGKLLMTPPKEQTEAKPETEAVEVPDGFLAALAAQAGV